MKSKRYLMVKDINEKFRDSPRVSVEVSVHSSFWKSVFDSIWKTVDDSVSVYTCVKVSVWNSVSDFLEESK